MDLISVERKRRKRDGETALYRWHGLLYFRYNVSQSSSFQSIPCRITPKPKPSPPPKKKRRRINKKKIVSITHNSTGAAYVDTKGPCLTTWSSDSRWGNKKRSIWRSQNFKRKNKNKKNKCFNMPLECRCHCNLFSKSWAFLWLRSMATADGSKNRSRGEKRVVW